jgi:uroporphyrin-III C-methyltransferase/precorrin-2 dehydrogenase/sirohydrochlorin ferrochelatase
MVEDDQTGRIVNAGDGGDELFPLFLKLGGRAVLLVGGGPVATGKAHVLAAAGADVTVVAPEVSAQLLDLAAAQGWSVRRRAFVPEDTARVWLIIAAAPPEVNRAVSVVAEARHLFVIAVDDVASATAYGAGVVRRAGVTVAVSTSGHAPALAGLLREGLEAVLPDESTLASWVAEAERQRKQWRAEGTPMAQRRPRLLAAINKLYEARAVVSAPPSTSAGPSGGRVTLIGAGPGDPDLLTLRGARLLAEADLVLYDALSSQAMRAIAPQARWFYVGKRACRQSIRQETLNRILIKEAVRGRHVVRLKAGDPFVFGRGGEEALALAHAGIPCEVIPGVSSAVAAAGLAGIPVTHRGASSAFTVVSGHHESVYRPVLEATPAGGVTIVVMMGLRHRAAIATLLLARGWSPTTPAAVVLGAATPEAWRWIGTLADLPVSPISDGTTEDDLRRPGVLVIGDVVAVATEIESARARVAGDGGVARATEEGRVR